MKTQTITKTILFTFAICLFANASLAYVINIPADQPTIQEGIDVAIDGDTVLVDPGTYVENINFNGKAITVASNFLTTNDTAYISQTIIDGSGIDRTVLFVNGEGSTAMLSGFTITNGNGTDGGGIYCYQSNPTLDHLILQNNTAVSGGGIYCYNNSSPEIKDVTFIQNTADYGGGIYCRMSSSPIIENAHFIGNTAIWGGGIFCWADASPELTEVLFDGNDAELGGGLYFGQDSNGSLAELIVSNNTAEKGAGIYLDGSDPLMNNITINNNSAWIGGAIYASESNPLLTDIIIKENSADYVGGGVYTETSSPELSNVLTDNNSGGGMEFRDGSNPNLHNVTITNNTASYGAGLCFYNSSAILNLVIISHNTSDWEGGGIRCLNTNLEIKDVSITYNASSTGGGIYCDNATSISFDPDERCNIYMNSAIHGLDIYSESYLEVVVDTFTVIQPTDYFTSPIDNFSFDIINGLLPQVAADLYVSPDGDNNNGGLTSSDPLKNIRIAFSKIIADSLNPRTIHLLEGTYSSTSNEEYFPLGMPDYVSLIGASEDGVILDAEGLAGVLKILSNKQTLVSNLTVTGGGETWGGGGINISLSDATIQNVTISGNTSNNVGGGICCSGCSPLIQNVTFEDNNAYNGGGLECSESSSPVLQDVIFTNNSAYNGGAIACSGASPEILDVLITGNSASSCGGGIYYYNGSSGLLENVTLSDNSSSWGGGICFKNSDPVLSEVLINENSAGGGGGISVRYSDIVLQDVIIRANIAEEGGGIEMIACEPVFENVTISNNSAETGGGIFNYESSAVFDSINRCNIYFNDADIGKDLYSETEFSVVVDTFTVLHPTDYYAEQIGNFTFDILNGKIEQLDADLFISPYGNNENSGLTYNEPLQNIDYAFAIILTDSLHPHTIHLLEGTYSTSATEEVFPLYIPDYISLMGESETRVVLDAEGQSEVIKVFANVQTDISKLTVTGGNNTEAYSGNGGGISCSGLNITLQNLTIINNESYMGGGIYCGSANAVIKNVLISSNNAEQGGGLYWAGGSNLVFDNSTTSGNSAVLGGGVYFDGGLAHVDKVVISGNSAERGGGVRCTTSSPLLTNTLIQGNSATFGGGLSIWASNPVLLNVDILENTAVDEASGIEIEGGYYGGTSDLTLINSIIWGEEEQGIYFGWAQPHNHITVSRSDIMGGEAGININGYGIVNWLEGNINEDPQFIISGDDPYQLSPASPCIDMGTPDTSGLNLPEGDLLNNLRIWDGDGNGIPIIDMGVYEFGSVPVEVEEFSIRHSAFDIRCFPNPFQSKTTIHITLPDAGFVNLEIHDITGRKIKTLHSGFLHDREHEFIWDAEGFEGGLYLLRLEAKGIIKSRKLLLLN